LIIEKLSVSESNQVFNQNPTKIFAEEGPELLKLPVGDYSQTGGIVEFTTKSRGIE